jgi:hypothetical protein
VEVNVVEGASSIRIGTGVGDLAISISSGSWKIGWLSGRIVEWAEESGLEEESGCLLPLWICGRGVRL